MPWWGWLVLSCWGTLGLSGWWFTVKDDLAIGDFAMLPVFIVAGLFAWTTVQ